MAYPATLQINTPERVANWRPLVHWLLAIPHFIVLAVLGLVAEILAIIAWLAILITGRLPAGIAGFGALYIRYGARVGAYANFLTVQYPAFDFTTTAADPGGSETTVSISPALEGRNRLTTLVRLVLMIPALIYYAIMWIVAGICVIIGFFAVLFTGRWPAGLRRMVEGYLRVQVRFNAYWLLLTDDYPPFELD